jgi:HAD superfamily hydrolase (TIGR01509 family)
MIETVFLDAGGVLVYPNWARVADTFARHRLIVDAGVLRRVEPAARFAIDNPHADTIRDADRGGRYFNHVLDSARVPRGPARDSALAEVYAYHMEHNLWEQVPDDVRPALERLRQAGLKLAVASNANGVLERCLDRLGLTQYFDVVCDSALEGVEKPDPRFFQLLLERTRARAETTLHVGDLYHIDVLGARGAGLRALLLDRDNLYSGFDAERVMSLDEVVSIAAGHDRGH